MIAYETMIVTGKVVRLKPYTEKRFKALMAVADDIEKYINDNPNQRLAEIDLDVKAEWWKRKGDILWDCDDILDIDFYKSENFESSQLKKAQDFFLQHVMFL